MKFIQEFAKNVFTMDTPFDEKYDFTDILNAIY